MKRKFFTRLLTLTLWSFSFSIEGVSPAVWIGNTNDMYDPNNWDPSGIPNLKDLIFDATALTTTPQLSSGNILMPDEITFFDSTPFTILLTDPITTLSVRVVGVLSNTTTPQFINVTNNATMSFINSTSANVNSNGVLQYNLTSSGNVDFLDFSRASNATFNLSGGSNLFFNDFSTASSATIQANNSTVSFLDGSSASDALLQLQNGSQLFFTIDSGGNSNVFLTTGSTATFSGPNTVGQLNSDASSTINLGDSLVSVGSLNTNGTIAGPLTGTTASLEKVGTGTLFLSGPQITYTGGTTISGGTLESNTNTLVGNVVANAIFNLNQSFDGTFNGQISGTGTFNKQGSGAVQLITDNSAFTGNTNVNEGVLILNNSLGGTIFVNTLAKLSGIGTAIGDLTINSGGTVSPGNGIGIGTLNIGGNFTQQPGSTYITQINAAGNSSLLNIAGSATLNGGTVDVVSVDGQLPAPEYHILHANSGVSGTFSNVTLNNPYLTSPVLRYDPFNVYLDFISGAMTNFVKFAKTSNQRHVAIQFDRLIDPTADERTVINSMLTLDPSQLRNALDQMSGEQYTTLIQLDQLGNRRFLRQLYANMRRFTTEDPNCCNPCSQGIEVWMDGDVEQAFLDGDRNTRGFKLQGCDFSIGAHKYINSSWILGIAGTYNVNHVHYRLGGTANQRLTQGALYAGYSNPCLYAFSDLLFGYNNCSLKRHIEFAAINRKARSRPECYHATLYTEVGTNIPWRCLLIQPFVGFDVGFYHRRTIKEHGADSLNLDVEHKEFVDTNSRMGLHLSTPLSCDFMFYADVAWDHCFGPRGRRVKNSFENFGEIFSIIGVNQTRDSVDGAIMISKALSETFEVYGEFSGERSNRFSMYGFTFGLDAYW